MLERVPATAESAAHLFLKSFERPCRSARILDPKFWRYGVDDLDTAAWWPSYLQQVRQVEYPRSLSSNAMAGKRWGHRNNSGGKDVRVHQQHVPGTRPFTASTPQSQQAQAQPRGHDVLGREEDVNIQSNIGDEATEHVWAARKSARQEQQEALHSELSESQIRFRGGHPQSRYSRESSPKAVARGTASNSPALPASTMTTDHTDSYALTPRTLHEFRWDTLRSIVDLSKHNHKAFYDLLRKKGEIQGDDFAQAWRLFIGFDIQEKIAPYMFKFLARSERTLDMSRALEAFRLIPRDERAEQQYRAAVILEQKRYQHRNAMNLAFEAAVKGFDLLPEMFAYFVRNLLWDSAAELLYRNKTARRDMAAFASEPQPDHSGEMLPEWKLLQACEQVEALHLKLLSLAERLRSYNAELLEHKGILDMCLKRLTVRCLKSNTQIDRIPASGLLALFELQNDLGLSNLHEMALHTIFHLPNRKNKADLALMTYRNLRFSLPDQPVSKWMIGGLIGMCSEVNYSLEIYNYLLDEFEDHHGRPDKKAYQRILTSCARQGNVDAVWRTYAQYRSHYDMDIDVGVLTPLIYCRAVTGDIRNARKAFNRVKRFGLEQNEICWNMLMLAHARSSDDVSAFDVFEEMQEAKVTPDSYTYGILLSVCDAHGDTEAALELLANARDNGVQITVPMVNTVIETYLSHRDVAAAMRFAIATSTSGTTKPLTRLWNSFLRYFAGIGDITALTHARNMMSKYHVKADEMTYAAVMSALTSTYRTSEAVALLQQMHNNQGLRATAFHYSIILHGFFMEGNRDMITVVANEMKQRFPKLSPDANLTLVLSQSRRDEASGGQTSHSIAMLESILKDLYMNSGASSHFDPSFSKVQDTSVVASLYLETTIASMIRSGSYEDAERLLDHLQTFILDTNKSGGSLTIVLARMDILIARGDHQKLAALWDQLFEHGSRSLKPLRSLREQHAIADPVAESPSIQETQLGATFPGGPQTGKGTKVLKAWRTSLSKPFNRYLEGMAREGRLDEVIDFVSRRFRGAGFRFTGINWNKYVQVLCRSSSVNHHVHAFAMTEKLMLNRAQSWTLLRRGFLRQKQISYSFEAVGEHKRPVLQKRSSYSVAKRLRVMHYHPRRVIPTYTTMVHLGSVLLHAQRQAEGGSVGELEAIMKVGGDTKKFLQRMPHLKDDVQGELLRGDEKSSNPRPRPRSEQSFRKKSTISGILDHKSPFDHLPAEFFQDIEAIAKPGSDVRYQLKKSLSPAKSKAKTWQDVQLGEKFFGQIARAPIVLAGQGRLETESERVSRVEREEIDMSRKVAALRDEFERRQLTGEVYSRELDSSVRDLYREGPVRLALPAWERPSLSTFPELVREPVLKSGFQSTLQDTLMGLPVREQMKMLQQLRGRKVLQNLPSASGSLPGTRALPYAARRRIGRLRARKQRNEARRLLDMLGRENVSDRAVQPRTAAGRRALLFEQARRRRQAYLQYEADVKAGKRLDPLPKTERGFWERLVAQGPPNIRFIADLNRHPARYFIRRGLMLEKRRPIVPPRDLKDRKFKARKRHVLTMIKKKELKILRRARRGLPPPVRAKFKPLAVGTRLGEGSTVEGEPYMPR